MSNIEFRKKRTNFNFLNFFNEIQYLTPYISGNTYPRLIIQIDSNISDPKLQFSE